MIYVVFSALIVSVYSAQVGDSCDFYPTSSICTSSCIGYEFVESITTTVEGGATIISTSCDIQMCARIETNGFFEGTIEGEISFTVTEGDTTNTIATSTNDVITACDLTCTADEWALDGCDCPICPTVTTDAPVTCTRECYGEVFEGVLDDNDNCVTEEVCAGDACDWYPTTNPCDSYIYNVCAASKFVETTTTTTTNGVEEVVIECDVQVCMMISDTAGILEVVDTIITTTAGAATINANAESHITEVCGLSCTADEMILGDGCGCPSCPDTVSCSLDEKACCGTDLYDTECDAQDICDTRAILASLLDCTSGDCPSNGGQTYATADECCAINMDDCCSITCPDDSVISGVYVAVDPSTDATCDYSQSDNTIGECGSCTDDVMTCPSGSETTDVSRLQNCSFPVDDCCVKTCSDNTILSGVYVGEENQGECDYSQLENDGVCATTDPTTCTQECNGRIFEGVLDDSDNCITEGECVGDACDWYPNTTPCDSYIYDQCAASTFVETTTTTTTNGVEEVAIECDVQVCMMVSDADGNTVGILEVVDTISTMTAGSNVIDVDAESHIKEVCGLSCAADEMILGDGCGCPSCPDSECSNVDTFSCGDGQELVPLIDNNCEINNDDCCIATCPDVSGAGAYGDGVWDADVEGCLCDDTSTTEECDPSVTFDCGNGDTLEAVPDNNCEIDENECCIEACTDDVGITDGVWSDNEGCVCGTTEDDDITTTESGCEEFDCGNGQTLTAVADNNCDIDKDLCCETDNVWCEFLAVPGCIGTDVECVLDAWSAANRWGVFVTVGIIGALLGWKI